MGTSNYPEQIDTDVELPRIDDNLTEIGADAINSIRDAIFAIENTVGVSPQGNAASLAARINVALDSNGNIKASALANANVITGPIDNNDVATGAAIAESKLDLDFSTQSLKNSVNSLSVDVAGLQSGIASVQSQFNLHINGLDHFHDGYQIKINATASSQIGIGGLEATTIGDAVSEIGNILFGENGHIDIALREWSRQCYINMSIFTK